MLSPEEQTEFFCAIEKVQQAALNNLQAHRNRQFAITFIAKLQLGVDQVVQATMDQGQKLDCRAGCSYCCNVRVEALEPEIFRIANELRTISAENLAALITRLQAHAARTRGLSVMDHRIACPFLIENLCSIYPFRPAVCRKAHSFDVEKCREPGSDIPQSLNIALKAEALMKGTSSAYRQIDLPASGHELGQAVLLALSDETAETRWYRGELVFDGVC